MVRPRSILPGSATGDSLVDGDRLGRLPTSADVDDDGLAGGERHALLLERLEALQLGRHLVAAERQQRRAIDAVHSSRDDARRARCRCS